MRARHALILLTGLTLAGCTSTSPWSLKNRPLNIPALPTELAQECFVPPVKRNAKQALLEHRVALQACHDRHLAVVDSYDAVRRAYGLDDATK